MSHVKTLDALDMEFQYYSCLVKDLITMLPNRCEQYTATAWLRKLSEPLYNAEALREKRNHYLLMLTICMILKSLKQPFDKYPPEGALKEASCISNPKKKSCPSVRCKVATEEHEKELPPCHLHGTECPGDPDNIMKVLDDIFQMLINLSEPYACKLSDPSDRRRARKWISFLSSIESNCSQVKGIRNDYAMLLSGYLLNDELPGPFIQMPIEKIIPLEILIKTVDMNNYMKIDPTNPKTLKFFRDVPHPQEGAFAFIAISGEICESFVRRK